MATKKKLKKTKKGKGSKAKTVRKDENFEYNFPMDLKSMKKRKAMTMRKT
mgnify:FL=1